VRAAVEAVGELHAEKTSTETVTVTKVAQALGINKMAASRRIRTAVAAGWLINLEQRRGHPLNLEPGEPMPEASGLPVLSDNSGDGNTVAAYTDRDVVPPPTEEVGEREVLHL
jgi:hypothetical protein